MCSKKNGKATCSSSSSNWLITAILSHPFTSIQPRSHRGLAACRARVVSSTVNHRSRSRGLIRGSPRSCTTRRLYFVAYNARDDNRTNPIISPPRRAQWPNANRVRRTCYVGQVARVEIAWNSMRGTNCSRKIEFTHPRFSIYMYVYGYRVFFLFLIRREIGQIKIRSEFESGTRIYSVFGSSVLTRKRIFFSLRVDGKFPLFPRKRDCKPRVELPYLARL